MRKISCIIPAYNEAPRIAAVLRAAETVVELDEIIVVDDGSTDDTVVRITECLSPRIRLIEQPTNRGKSAAVATGIAQAQGNFVLLLDADLEGIAPEDIRRLIAPVQSGAATVSFSLRKNAPFFYRWLDIDPITGERCFSKDSIEEHLEEVSTLSSFGLEVYMNRLLLLTDTRLAVVPWNSVSSPYKYWKHGFIAGLIGDIRMFRDILGIVSISEYLHQVRTLRRLSRAYVPNEEGGDAIQLSIIVPAYNEERSIGLCIEHILASQAAASVRTEIIVVNNASTDSTEDIVANYPTVRLVHESEKGLTRARQRGLTAAHAPIIAYVDADTLMPVSWIQNVHGAFMRNQKTVCVSGPYEYLNIPTSMRVFFWLYWRVIVYPSYLILGYFAVGGNFAVRKDAVMNVGGFDDSIAFYGEDTDIARRLKKVGRVYFTLSLPMPTSARRFAHQGFLKTCVLYAANFLAIAFFKRPVSQTYSDIR